MINAQQRDDVHGTAASASATSYLARRQGDLKRASDGFRSPMPSTEPRRPLTGGREPHPPVRPYHYNPRPPEDGEKFNTPRTFQFFRQPDLGAPRVPFPERERTQGRLQQSGAAWGRVAESERPRLAPPIQGRAPIFETTDTRGAVKSAVGPRWQWPTTPKIYTR